ncbi:MAG: sugar phosphate isomerase/epimerase family protein [Planctomycetaceae bacterium]
MDRLKIAVAAHCFAGPLKRSLQAIAQSGARGIQFDAQNELKPAEFSETGRRQFLHHLDELGLSVASLTFPTRAVLYDLEQLEPRVAAIKGVLEFSAQLKARVVAMRIGRIPDEPQAEEFLVLRDVLNDLCRYGNHVGATLAITPMSDSAESLKRLFATISSGPIGVNFDPANCIMSGQEVGANMRALHDVLIHIQIRDAIRDLDGSGQEVPVGRGQVDWEEFLALVDEAAYHGWLTVDRTQGEDQAGDVTRAVQYLRQVAQG